MRTRIGRIVAGIVTASLSFMFLQRIFLRWVEMREHVLKAGPIAWREEFMVLNNALADPSMALIAMMAIAVERPPVHDLAVDRNHAIANLDSSFGPSRWNRFEQRPGRELAVSAGIEALRNFDFFQEQRRLHGSGVAYLKFSDKFSN